MKSPHCADRVWVDTHEIAAELHHLVDQLTRPNRLETIQPGDLVQIAPDSDNAYSGLPAIVQRVHGNRIMASVLRPHRGGVAFPFSRCSLIRLGRLNGARHFHQWADTLDKTCDDCRRELKAAHDAARDTRHQRRPAASEAPPAPKLRCAP